MLEKVVARKEDYLGQKRILCLNFKANREKSRITLYLVYSPGLCTVTNQK